MDICGNLLVWSLLGAESRKCEKFSEFLVVVDIGLYTPAALVIKFNFDGSNAVKDLYLSYKKSVFHNVFKQYRDEVNQWNYTLYFT